MSAGVSVHRRSQDLLHHCAKAARSQVSGSSSSRSGISTNCGGDAVTVIDNIAERLGSSDVRMDSSGVQWFDVGDLSVRELATAMKACRARFVTITAIELPGNEGLRLEYLWDLDGQLLGFSFHLETNSIESIFDICEATDWIEREIHEGFAVDFVGRAYEPLLLREGNNLGVNLREEIR
jgi:hypothetical protein